MTMPPLRSLLLLALAVLPGSLEAAADSAPKSTASFRFVSFATLKDVCVHGPGGKFVPVQTPATFIGAPVRIPVDGPVTLFLKSPAAAPDSAGTEALPESAFTRLTTFNAAEAPRQLVLIFGDARTGFKAQAVPDNAERFPYGRVLAINLTGAPLHMSLGGSEFALPPQGSLLCPPAKTKTDLGDFAVKVVDPSPAAPKVLYSTVWPSGPKLRTMAFLYKDAAGRLMVRTIEDPEVKELVEAPSAKPGKSSKGAPRRP